MESVQVSATCSITGDFMIDPVMAEDGHVYERSAITLWFAQSSKSPLTGETIGMNLVSYPELRSAIRDAHPEVTGDFSRNKQEPASYEFKTEADYCFARDEIVRLRDYFTSDTVYQLARYKVSEKWQEIILRRRTLLQVSLKARLCALVYKPAHPAKALFKHLKKDDKGIRAQIAQHYVCSNVIETVRLGILIGHV